MKKTSYWGVVSFLIFFFVLSPLLFAADETITLTTYYPSPVGVYKQLRLAPQSSPPTCDASQEGMLYYNSTTHAINVCGSGSVWQPTGAGGYWNATGNDIFNTNTGRVGIGTMNPTANLHIASAGNPTVTIATTTYGGSNAATLWLKGYGAMVGQQMGQLIFSNINGGTVPIAAIRAEMGNGGNFYGRMFFWTGGPAGGDRMVIDENGNIGVGTTNPTAKLDVSATSNTAVRGISTDNNGVYAYSTNWMGIWAESATWYGVYGRSTSPLARPGVCGSSINGAGVQASSTNSVGVLGMSSGNAAGVQGTASGNFFAAMGVYGFSSNSIGVYGSGQNGAKDFQGFGNEWAGGGTWNPASDRNLKENFTPIDDNAILEKISQLPMVQWNYKNDKKKIKHIAPIAQDFYAIFHASEDEKTISQVDPAGVALVGIKALNKKAKEQDQKISDQAAQIKALKEEIESLKMSIKKP